VRASIGPTGPVNTLAFTGHRPSRLRPVARSRLKARITRALAQARRRGACLLYTGLADGADHLAAEAALALGLRLHGVLPGPIAAFDAGGVSGRARFHALLAACHAVTVLDPRPGPITAARHAEVSMWMLARAGRLVAVYDGAGSRGLGGVAWTLALARRRGLPVNVISV